MAIKIEITDKDKSYIEKALEVSYPFLSILINQFPYCHCLRVKRIRFPCFLIPPPSYKVGNSFPLRHINHLINSE